MERSVDRETTLKTGHRSGSFSIDSLLSNTYKGAQNTPELCHKSMPYDTDLDITDGKSYKDGHELADFSQKHLNLVRHIKNIDTYLPWISPNSNFFAHHTEHLYEDAKRIIPAEGYSGYSNLHLPFLYSSWLPVAAASNPVTKNTKSDGELGYTQSAYSRNSPREENSDSDDSKSDISRISDTPKDFSCSKQRLNGKFAQKHSYLCFQTDNRY